jgi:uncharacterized protein (TIGR03083 family)
MESPKLWDLIHAERRALADDLANLEASRWDTPSLCAGWTVRDVLAHMTATARMTPPGFFGKLLMAGFNFGTMTAREIAAERGTTPNDTLARFSGQIASSSHPPGPNDSWLGETLVHAEDIRKPLGIAHAYPTAAAVQVANFYKGSNLLIGAKNRIAGLSLRATDTDWQHGEGPIVTGPIMALVVAMTGRRAAVDDLSGEGVSVLRERCR